MASTASLRAPVGAPRRTDVSAQGRPIASAAARAARKCGVTSSVGSVFQGAQSQELRAACEATRPAGAAGRSVARSVVTARAQGEKTGGMPRVPHCTQFSFRGSSPTMVDSECKNCLCLWVNHDLSVSSLPSRRRRSAGRDGCSREEEAGRRVAACPKEGSSLQIALYHFRFQFGLCDTCPSQ